MKKNIFVAVAIAAFAMFGCAPATQNTKAVSEPEIPEEVIISKWVERWERGEEWFEWREGMEAGSKYDEYLEKAADIYTERFINKNRKRMESGEYLEVQAVQAEVYGHIFGYKRVPHEVAIKVSNAFDDLKALYARKPYISTGAEASKATASAISNQQPPALDMTQELERMKAVAPTFDNDYQTLHGR